MITVVLAKHNGSPKKYTFLVPSGHTIKNGQSIIVDTQHGMQTAVACSDSIDVASEESAKELFDGVKLPLRRVLMAETTAWEPLFDIPFSLF